MPREARPPPACDDSSSAAADDEQQQALLRQSLTVVDECSRAADAFHALARERLVEDSQWRGVARQTVSPDNTKEIIAMAVGGPIIPHHQGDLGPHASSSRMHSSQRSRNITNDDNGNTYYYHVTSGGGDSPSRLGPFRPAVDDDECQQRARGGEPSTVSEFASKAYRGYNTTVSPDSRRFYYSYPLSSESRESHGDCNILAAGGRKRTKSDSQLECHDSSSSPRRPPPITRDTPLADDSLTGSRRAKTDFGRPWGSAGDLQTRRRVVHYPRPIFTSTASCPASSSSPWAGIQQPTSDGTTSATAVTETDVGRSAHNQRLLSSQPWSSDSVIMSEVGGGEAAPLVLHQSENAARFLNGPPPSRPRTHSNNHSSNYYRGVRKATVGENFVAYVPWHGTNHVVGMFDSEIEAAAAHDSALKSMLGEYALPQCLNFPPQEGATAAAESAHHDGPRNGLREPVSEMEYSNGDGAAFNNMLPPRMESPGGGSQLMTQPSSAMTSNPGNNRQQIKSKLGPKPPASSGGGSQLMTQPGMTSSPDNRQQVKRKLPKPVPASSGGGSQLMTQPGMTSSPDNRQQVKRKLPKPPASAASSETQKQSSHYRGVCWNKKDKKWQSMIFSKGKSIWLGYFKKEEDAARAYNAAAIRERGHKAKLNVLDSRDVQHKALGPGPAPPERLSQSAP